MNDDDGVELHSIEHPPGGIERAAAFAAGQMELLDKDELIAALRTRIGELIAEAIELKVENRKLSGVYTAAENLACPIGMEGEVNINTSSVLYVELMDAMFNFDDGQHKKTMTEEYLESETEHMKGRESE